MSDDDDFDDFLARRKPLFRRPTGDGLEPPGDVDRLVLRQARDAIEPPRHMQEIRTPGWGMPLALAATLLVALTVVLDVMVPKKSGSAGDDVRQVAQHLESPAPAAAPTTEAAAAGAAAAPNNPARGARAAPRGDLRPPAAPGPANQAEQALAKTPVAPPWRRDSQSWLAEIDKLRAQGRSAEADAELAEYKREHRAYASGPDR